MKSRTNKSLLMAGCILVFATFVYSVRAIHAGTDQPSYAGMLPYTPTRLEWLELNLEANFREEDDVDPAIRYSINYVARPPNTIVIFAQYSKRTPAGLVDKAIEHCKRMAEKEASSRGWSQWVKIEVKRDLDED